ncbi:MAG: acyltransferase [Candidatus Electrothrix sp. AUS4]|nr:acyltransferase [Candidatus Electrothrix sp. AUS4]
MREEDHKFEKKPPLTGIRAVAALMVMLFHFQTFSGEKYTYPVFDSILSNGNFGVEMFFVLSGFILWHVYHVEFSELSRISYKNYIIRRLARIYPVHILTMILMLCVYFVARFQFHYTPQTGHSPYSLASIIASIFLVNEWLNPHDILVKIYPFTKINSTWGPLGTPNGVAWSISVEFLMYLFFPFIALLFYKLKKSRLFLVFICLCGLVGFILVPQNIFRILFLFPLGCFVYSFKEYLPRINIYLLFLALFSFISAIEQHDFFYFTACLLCPLLYVQLLTADNYLSKILSSPLFVYLGEISFTLYMVHWPVLSITRNIARHVPNAQQYTGFGILLTALLSLYISHICYKKFEKPLAVWMRKEFIEE